MSLGSDWTLVQRLGSEWTVLKFLDVGNGEIYALTGEIEDPGIPPSSIKKLYRSRDYGKTWILVTELPNQSANTRGGGIAKKTGSDIMYWAYGSGV